MATLDGVMRYVKTQDREGPLKPPANKPTLPVAIVILSFIKKTIYGTLLLAEIGELPLFTKNNFNLHVFLTLISTSSYSVFKNIQIFHKNTLCTLEDLF